MMSKPLIKQKPIIKPKPPAKPTDLIKSKEFKNACKDDELNSSKEKAFCKIFDESTSSNELNELTNESKDQLTIKSTNKFSQQVLDRNQLNKAFQLLNQSNLTEKDESEYDIRVDEDQIETCNQIIKNLLNAGYYKANIIGLSEFDKIIGGMCWCIELCNINIDIDLFYQDSLSIGQKIALTEKIVKVLKIMKCPHFLEPHQIQGLDCINILPVVQWLIKESNEFSMQIKDYIDMFASYKFDCDHSSLNQNKEDPLIITRSKEAKKIIKEYFNKNEIKINLEFKRDELEKELENLDKLDHQLSKDKEKLQNELITKNEVIQSIEDECIKLKDQLVENHDAENKELALDYTKLINKLKEIKLANKLTKMKMKKEYESLLNSTKIEMNNDLEQQLEFEKDKLDKLKEQLAQKNKNYLVLRRKFDNILSKEEMNQYQKRFIELSAQVSNKLNETKKFYILFNQLESTKKQLENKFIFFESLIKCFNQLNPNNSQMNQQFFFTARTKD